MIIKGPLFTPKEQKEMGRYLEALEQAAEREIQATPQRRDEIVQHYQAKADSYIGERRTEKRKANTKAFWWGSVLAAVIVVFGVTSNVRWLTNFGVALFFMSLGNAWLSKPSS